MVEDEPSLGGSLLVSSRHHAAPMLPLPAALLSCLVFAAVPAIAIDCKSAFSLGSDKFDLSSVSPSLSRVVPPVELLS